MVLCLPLVSAQWIQSSECSSYDPETVFWSPADICFYGSGFEQYDTVDVSLGSYELNDVEVSNGIVSSFIDGDEFNNIPEGDYDLVVEDVQYSEKIHVYAQGEIPEFSTLTALMVIGLAGLFVALRRK